MKTNKTDTERAEITSEARRYIMTKSLSSSLPRELLASQLSEEIKDKNGKHPHVDTLKRMISKVRNDVNPLDQYWSLGSLSIPEYQIDPAVVPILVKELAKRETQDTQPITVWQALWASRLYSTISVLLKDKPEAIDESLIYWSGEYTLKEKISRYAGESKLDTTDFDKEMYGCPDMSEATWSKKPNKPFFFPPSHFGLLATPNIDFAKRDKIRKARQKKREKEGEIEQDHKWHFEKEDE